MSQESLLIEERLLEQTQYKTTLLNVRDLLPTEEINRDRAVSLSQKIKQDGTWTRPLFIELTKFVIMDGHHRLFVAGLLGLARVPCVCLAYDDPNLQVMYWSKPAPYPTNDIIKAGVSGKLLGFKTTRHALSAETPRCVVPLQDLR